MPKSDRIDPNSPAAKIAAKFGGTTALGKALDPPRPPSTIHRWLLSGFVPSKRQQDVMEAARRKRIRLHPREFIA